MEILPYYTSQSPYTDPGANAGLLSELPKEPQKLAGTLQGLMLMHDEICKYPIQNERVRDTLYRYAEDILTAIVKLDKTKSPLTEERPGDLRFIANSSDFATLMVSILRSKGVPARKRTGFIPSDVCYDGETYNRIHDVVEYWDGKAWALIDPTGRAKAEEFIPAAKAWRDCRVGYAAPDKFRDEERRDFEVLTAALLLDLAGLGKRELTVWDRYGWAATPFTDFDSRQWETLDELARVLRKGDEGQEELVALYTREPGLQVPAEICCLSMVVPPHSVVLKK